MYFFRKVRPLSTRHNGFHRTSLCVFLYFDFYVFFLFIIMQKRIPDKVVSSFCTPKLTKCTNAEKYVVIEPHDAAINATNVRWLSNPTHLFNQTPTWKRVHCAVINTLHTHDRWNFHPEYEQASILYESWYITKWHENLNDLEKNNKAAYRRSNSSNNSRKNGL